jgi:ankyrin repeat protein
VKRLFPLCLIFLVVFIVFQQRSETRTGFDGSDTLASDPLAETVSTFTPSQPGVAADETELRVACSKAINLIQQSQVVWYQRQTCTSCHHQLLPEIPFKLARQRGVHLDENIAADSTAKAFGYLKDLDAAVQGYDYIDVLFDGWALVAAQTAGVRPSLSTAAYAKFIANRQSADGSWPTIDSRPPQAHSVFATTAVCASALESLPARHAAEKAARVQRAREWFLAAEPRTIEDRVFQILGLRWTGASEEALKPAADRLLVQQNPDGGWSQLPTLASDSYATGSVLVALHEGAGLEADDPAYQRGVTFLLRSQQPDGSWRTKSRLHPPAPVSPPYVSAEFPHGRDQFISIMGTSWALTALLHAIPATKPHSGAALPDLSPPDRADWIRVALTGPVEELRELLDGGLSPNSKTAAGTTALMLSAHDLEKVKLLLERGAELNTRAASGLNALMVASRHRGNSEVVRLLLRKGARPTNPKGVAVRNDASALFLAAMGGDLKTIKALIDAGANPNEQMQVLGALRITALTFAAVGGDSAAVEYLIRRGADVNKLDADRISALGWATLTNHPETLRVLLARGARVNQVDRFGMTPLLYAASIDFGDTRVIEQLVAAGATIGSRNKDGLTALDLARKYNHPKLAEVLASKSGVRR